MAKHSLLAGVTLPADTAKPLQATEGSVQPTAKPSKGEAAMIKTTTYLSRAVHEKLREIAFHERRSINDLVMEGLDLMLQRKSYPTTKELTERAKAS